MFGRKGDNVKTRLEAVPTPVQVAIDRARAVLADHANANAAIAQLQADRVTAREIGDADKLMRANADLEIAQHRLPKKAADAMASIGAIYTSAAGQARALAEEKRAQRENILQKLRKPCAEIALLIGVDEVPLYALRCIPQGTWEKRFGMDAPNFNELGPGDCHPGVPAANSRPYATPSFDLLAGEIAAHERRAVELAERQVDASGDLNAVLESISAEVAPVAKAMEAA
jgi:hypothetical protein